MADPQGPGKTGRPIPGSFEPAARPDDDLVRRGRDLEAAIAARRPLPQKDGGTAPRGGMAGMAQALRLSSEFVAGIAVGAGLGWAIDYFAGTSPWGLIVFLLLGFVAGVLNALRSAGLIAEVGVKAREDLAKGREKE